MIVYLCLSFLIAFLISYYFQGKIISFLNQRNIVDRVDERKLRKPPKPRMGGIGLFLGFVIGVYVTLFIFANIYIKPNFINFNFESLNLFFLSVFIVFLIGLIDDVIGLNAFQKLPFEILAGTIMYFNGWLIKFISLPFPPYNLVLNDFISYLVTVLWIVGITNALNLIDGIDGLAGGITFFSLISFATIEIILGKPEYLILIIPMVGAVLGFLKYNLFPAKIYLGDSGSLTIGFFLSILSLKISIKASFGISFLIPIVILFIPIFDTTLAFFRRLIKGKNPFSADNEHIHHKLLKKGYSEKKVFIILMILDFIFSALGVLSIFVKKQFRISFLLILLVISFFMIVYLKYVDLNFIKRGLSKNRKTYD